MTRAAASADWVLHVRDRESDGSRAVDECLARNHLSVETCTDVYVALATLARRRAGRCLAIFLSVDWLDGCEHRFPDVAARFVGATPMWGYAAGRPSATFVSMASRRIRMVDDPGQLELIVSRIVRSAGQPPVAHRAAAPGPKAASPASAPRKSTPQQVPSSPPATDPTKPLPVPWAERPVNPSRVPPVSPTSPQERKPAQDIEDPVLTPEELDALTSGDRFERGEP